MIRLLTATLFCLAAGSAMAQYNPFLPSPSGPALRGEDLDLFLASVNQLNRGAEAKVGSSESWTNPRTGSHGLSRIAGQTTKADMRCNAIAHEISIGKAPKSRTTAFSLTWCLTADRGWKVTD